MRARNPDFTDKDIDRCLTGVVISFVGCALILSYALAYRIHCEKGMPRPVQTKTVER